MRVASVLSSSPVSSVAEVISVLNAFVASHHAVPVAGLNGIKSLQASITKQEERVKEEEEEEKEQIVKFAEPDRTARVRPRSEEPEEPEAKVEKKKHKKDKKEKKKDKKK